MPATRSATRTFCDQLAVVEDGDAVADLLHFIEQVARQDDGDAFLVDEIADQRAHLLDACRVEAVRRLIEDQEFGPRQQRGGQREALAHAHRIGARLAVGRVGEADTLEHGFLARRVVEAGMRAKARSVSRAVRKG